MIELLAHNLAPIMFLSLIFFLLMGYPVAFSLAANGLAFFVLAVTLSPFSDTITLDWPQLGTLPGRRRAALAVAMGAPQLGVVGILRRAGPSVVLAHGTTL